MFVRILSLENLILAEAYIAKHNTRKLLMLKNLRAILGFTKREMNGVLLLLPLACCLIILLRFYEELFPSHYDHSKDQALLDSLVKELKAYQAEAEDPATVYFNFDPNLISDDSFRLLGVPYFLVNRIANYKKAGGLFKKPEDLKRIYDFPDSLYIQLEDYIEIKVQERPHRPGLGNRQAFDTEKVVVKRSPKVVSTILDHDQTIDLNKADTIVLKKLYGIGSVYATRIVKYRNLLGGFVRVDQLKEVYGISDSLFQSILPKIFVTEISPAKINVNLASFKEINAHPYISYEQTKELFNSKSRIGKYKSIKDLYGLSLWDSVELIRLSPYLSFE